MAEDRNGTDRRPVKYTVGTHSIENSAEVKKNEVAVKKNQINLYGIIREGLVFKESKKQSGIENISKISSEGYKKLVRLVVSGGELHMEGVEGGSSLFLYSSGSCLLSYLHTVFFNKRVELKEAWCLVD